MARRRIHSRTYVFTPEQIESLRRQYHANLTFTAMARTIQEEWGHWKDLSPKAAEVFLNRNAPTILGEKTSRTQLRTREIAQALAGKRHATVTKMVSAMSELEWAAGEQKERIEKLLKKEKDSPLLLKSVSDELRLYKDILHELGYLQLETGVIRRAPKTMTGTITDTNGETQTVTWTETEERQLQLIEASAMVIDDVHDPV